MVVCKTCQHEKVETEFAVSVIKAGKTYRRRECRGCRGGDKPWGFAKRISVEEKKKILEHEQDFNTLTGAEFHRVTGLSMTLPTFYRYVRDDSFKKLYETEGENKVKS